MNKTSDISDEDIALFRETIGEIKSLKQDSIVVSKSKPVPTPAKTEADNRAVIDEMIDGEFDHSLLERGDELLFYRPGFQKQALKKLRRGQFNIEAELDLHGMTVDMARNALLSFLKDCTNKNKRCVRIIHGKGLGSKNKHPVIKNKLNNWLQKRSDVLAFCSARQVDGGTGAIYLLLKRK